MALSKKFSKDKNEELVKALREIFDDDEFVLGMRCRLKNDEEIEKVLSFIKEHEGVDSSDVILFSILLSRGQID